MPTIATFSHSIPDDPVPIEVKCRYGTVGDLLYVCESFARVCTEEHFDDDACDELSSEHIVEYKADKPGCRYPGDWDDADPEDAKAQPLRWKSGRYMPRRYARLLLRIKDVRCERVDTITPEDALAEGLPLPVVRIVGSALAVASDGSITSTDSRFAFACLWDTVNREYPFATGPWVWVLTFDHVVLNAFSAAHMLDGLPSARPITFRPELARAILDGRKTQTRRLLRHFDNPPEHGPDCATLTSLRHGVPRAA